MRGAVVICGVVFGALVVAGCGGGGHDDRRELDEIRADLAQSNRVSDSLYEEIDGGDGLDDGQLADGTELGGLTCGPEGEIDDEGNGEYRCDAVLNFGNSVGEVTYEVNVSSGCWDARAVDSSAGPLSGQRPPLTGCLDVAHEAPNGAEKDGVATWTPENSESMKGVWEGEGTQRAPSGARDDVDVRAEIPAIGLGKTIGSWKESIGDTECSGIVRLVADAGPRFTLAYTEQLNPDECIEETRITVTAFPDGSLGFRETYSTSIGRGITKGAMYSQDETPDPCAGAEARC